MSARGSADLRVMRLVPKTFSGKIGFYAVRVPKWAQDPEAIGSTPQEIAVLQEKLDAARAAYALQRQAQQAAQAATVAMHEAVGALTDAGSNVIVRVRGLARRDGGAMYNVAFIPPRNKPAPIAPPGTPSGFSFQLSGVGSLTLRWRCKNPKGSVGTMYHVWRCIGAADDFEYLGKTGKKQFLDVTLPAGVASVTYKVQAVRSTKEGGFALHPIHFGVAPGLRQLAESDLRSVRDTQTSGPQRQIAA